MHARSLPQRWSPSPPPNETHSHSLPVSINVPVTDGTGSAVKVDPVGTGK
ncbi:hypothetical protein JBE04_26725 [Streptomyces sp. PRKS01-29]|nr:hypothetical protein [Streptomyces sabulosicollis]MBI0297961.1 hypothetical protein [Streptomyces sabulosicollis]